MEVLSEFPTDLLVRTGRGRDWDMLFDGKIRKLISGTDFKGKAGFFRNTISTQAKKIVASRFESRSTVKTLSCRPSFHQKKCEPQSWARYSSHDQSQRTKTKDSQ